MNATRLLCFVLLICCQACKHQHTSSVEDKNGRCDELVDQMIVGERDFIAALDSVRDTETAKGAAEKIRECGAKFDAISAAFTRLGPLSPALRARLLQKLDVEDRQRLTMIHESVRVITPDEQNIITPAVEIFCEKWGEVCTKSGLYYTNEEYRGSRVQPDGAGNSHRAGQ